jgi:hypothetical protein
MENPALTSSPPKLTPTVSPYGKLWMVIAIMKSRSLESFEG